MYVRNVLLQLLGLCSQERSNSVLSLVVQKDIAPSININYHCKELQFLIHLISTDRVLMNIIHSTLYSLSYPLQCFTR